MSRPGVGNPGGRGGGRPSAYTERARAELLELAFFGDIDIEAIRKKLADKKKKNLWDIWLGKALSGNDLFLTKMFDKVFPSRSENYNHNEYVPTPLTPAEQQTRVNQLLDELNSIAATRRIRKSDKPTEPVLSSPPCFGLSAGGGTAPQGNL